MIQVHNARFRNKSVHSSVQAKHVHSQHQVDLVDMEKSPIDGKGNLHKYILSLMGF